MKGYFTFPKARALLEPHLSDCLVSYQDIRWESSTPLPRSSRCILYYEAVGVDWTKMCEEIWEREDLYLKLKEELALKMVTAFQNEAATFEIDHI